MRPSANNFLVPKGTSFIEDRKSNYVVLSGKIRPVAKNSLYGEKGQADTKLNRRMNTLKPENNVGKHQMPV